MTKRKDPADFLPNGRPTEYKEEYINEVDNYLKVCRDTYKYDESVNAAGDPICIPHFDVKLPTIEGFALYIGVGKQTLYTWAEIHPNFNDALDKIREEQHQRLMSGGLSGRYNPTIAKLVLSSNHGYAEKKETKLSGGINIEQLIDA